MPKKFPAQRFELALSSYNEDDQRTLESHGWRVLPGLEVSQNPDIYKLIGEITSGKMKDPAPAIREKLGANYIFSDAKENEDFITNCLESGWCEMVYEDDEARILKIRDQKGDAPKDTTADEAPPTPRGCELRELREGT